MIRVFPFRSLRTRSPTFRHPAIVRRALPWAILLACGLVAVPGSLLAQAPASPAPDSPATPRETEQAADQYDQWVSQLGSDQYVRREMASRRLFEAGPEVAPRLEEAIGSGDLETTERALQILQVIAIRQEPQQPPVAWEVLKRLTQTGSGSAATRAQEMMSVVKRRRIKRAREVLGEAGINVDLNGYLMQANASGSEVVHITDDWNGDPSVLSWLPWLYGIEFALLEGGSVEDEVIDQIAKMPDLHNLVFSKTEVDPGLLRRLAELPRIDTLELRYVPVGDEAIPRIAELPLRSSLSLIGTNISGKGVDRLRQQLPALQIDFKRGGFLGVECHPWAVRCEISRVLPGGAAERAGLQARDIITKVDDTEIERFADLQKAIGMHAPDEPVSIIYERLGQMQTTELRLGQLPGAPE